MSSTAKTEVEQALNNAQSDIFNLMQLYFPFPNAEKGESTESHFNRMSSQERINAQTIIQATLNTYSKSTQPPNERDYQEFGRQILLQNLELDSDKVMSKIIEAIMRRVVIQTFKETCVEIINSEESFDIKKAIGNFQALLEKIETDGYATAMTVCDNGDVAFLAPEQILSKASAENAANIIHTPRPAP